MPGTACWRPTTPRSRPISRSRSTPRRPTARRPIRRWRRVIPEPGSVAVLDFGRQFAQLIARRVRELNVYSELLPHDTPLAELERRGVRARSSSRAAPTPSTTTARRRPDAAIWSGRLPVLGICYGAQLMALELGGDVLPAARREYGPATVLITQDDGLFAGVDREQPVWMSHGDSITRLPEGFHATAQTDSTPYAGLAAPSRRLYGIQFHPEVVAHPARPGHPAQLRDGHRGHRARLDAGQLHRVDRRRDSRARRPARGTDRVRRAGDLRPVGWRRLGRRGGARAPGGRRPADLHLRRPRADAQEGVGAPARDLRGQPRHAPGDGRRA